MRPPAISYRGVCLFWMTCPSFPSPLRSVIRGGRPNVAARVVHLDARRRRASQGGLRRGTSPGGRTPSSSARTKPVLVVLELPCPSSRLRRSLAGMTIPRSSAIFCNRPSLVPPTSRIGQRYRQISHFVQNFVRNALRQRPCPGSEDSPAYETLPRAPFFPHAPLGRPPSVRVCPSMNICSGPCTSACLALRLRSVGEGQPGSEVGWQRPISALVGKGKKDVADYFWDARKGAGLCGAGGEQQHAMPLTLSQWIRSWQIEWLQRFWCVPSSRRRGRPSFQSGVENSAS